MNKRENITKKKDITKETVKKNVASGKTVPKELTEAQKTFRHIRDDVYDLSRDKLAAAIGLYDGSVIQNYETKPGYNISINTLIKCAEYYSTIPNVRNEINHVSLDYLLGRTKHTSVIDEVISQETGLSDAAINRLRRLKAKDQDNAAYNVEHLLDKFAYMEHIYTAIINFLLTSEHLEPLLGTLKDYIDPVDGEKLLAITENDTNYVKTLFAVGRTGLLRPIKTVGLLDRGTIKLALGSLIDKLSEEYRDKNRIDKIHPELLGTVFDTLYKQGYSYDEAMKIFSEQVPSEVVKWAQKRALERLKNDKDK